MKTKDLIYLSIAVALFVVVGGLFYAQFAPKKSTSQGTTVEVVAPISSDFNEKVINQLLDPAQARDFTPQIDLHNGLGNPKPFNPL